MEEKQKQIKSIKRN